MVGKSKSLILLLNAKNEADIVKAKVVDGTFRYEDKRFLVDQSDPILIKNSKGVKVSENTPCYICDWNDIEPSQNLNRFNFEKFKRIVRLSDKEEKKIKTIKTDRVKPEFDRKHLITPEMFNKLVDMKILGGMIPAGRKFPSFFALLIGLFGGMGIFMILYYTGILT